MLTLFFFLYKLIINVVGKRRSGAPGPPLHVREHTGLTLQKIMGEGPHLGPQIRKPTFLVPHLGLRAEHP